MTRPAAILGKKFNRWTVLERVENDKHGKARWRCRCDCGTITVHTTEALTCGMSQSCGCLHTEHLVARNYRHGHEKSGARSKEMSAFRAALTRCNNPKSIGFKNYGGRGIKFKFTDFQTFLQEVGPHPGKNYSLDRINNNGDYEPGNVRWATREMQVANRRVKYIYQFSDEDLLEEIAYRGYDSTPNEFLADQLDCSRSLIVYSPEKRSNKSMGWEQVNVADIQVSDEKTSFEPLPNGTYVLQVLSAEPGKFREGSVNITTSVTDEGEHLGRRVFIDLPNPDEQKWAPEVLARMIKAMGASMAPYADPVTTLNSIAQNGHSKFTADVYVREFTRNDGSQGKQNRVNYKSIRPAA